MSQTLQKMVEAMEDEIARQTAAHDGDPDHSRFKTRQPRAHIPPIGLDLEKVAQAGLAAIIDRLLA